RTRRRVGPSPVRPFDRPSPAPFADIRDITGNIGKGQPGCNLNFQASTSDRRKRIIADRGQPVRILLLSLLLMATPASAQSPPAVDCDALRNSVVPVELAYHWQDGTRMVVQAYRNK